MLIKTLARLPFQELNTQINELLVVSEFDPKKSGSHTNQSIVWRYFGALH